MVPGGLLRHYHSPDWLWMIAVISWWALDGHCYFLTGSGWMLFFPGGLWMVTVIF